MRRLKASRIFAFFVLLLIPGLSVFFFSQSFRNFDFELEFRNVFAHSKSEKKKSSLEPFLKETLSGTSSNSAGSTMAEDPVRSPNSEQIVPPSQIANWLSSEAKNLNSTNVNAALKEIEMRAKSEKLTSIERSELVEIAKRAESAINERILATYLLSLNSSPGSDTALSQIAEAVLPDNGVPTAHSAAELQRIQELSLRYSMVDELAQRARKDSQAHGTLKKLIDGASSSEVRNYARRKAAEIKSL